MRSISLLLPAVTFFSPRDHARKRRAIVHGSGRQREELDDVVEEVQALSQFQLLALNEALDQLAQRHPRAAAVVEMRIFGGYDVAEIAEAKGISSRTVERDLEFGEDSLRSFLLPQDEA